MKSDRRSFLKISAVGAVAAAAAGLPLWHMRRAASTGLGDGRPPRTVAPLDNWQDLYRQRWTWDHVAKGSHGWLNCRSACEWDIYVKKGVVVREEQTAQYESSEPGVVPDFNPRGCNKGACYTEVMYGPSRLTVPLKRVGERGSGQWERVSWDQAIDEIAHKMVDIAEKYGTDSVVQDLGPHFDNGPTTAGRIRFFNKFGGVIPDDWAEIGDLNLGATLTFGFPHVGGSSDEWFLSDYLVVWMMNPSVTQIPDAHFLYEAKYNGAKLAVIDPIYSATATHADLWIPVAQGTDAALALCIARHIWESGKHDEKYLQEQSDLPVLVRLDTGRFLREDDMVAGGRETVMFVHDRKTNARVPAPGSEGLTDQPMLHLGELDPALEGGWDVQLADGKTVQVVTVGTLLREQLALYSVEATAKITGLHSAMITRLAEGFANAERPMILSSWGSNRYFHSDLMNRAKILCLTLKGAIGRRGAGYHSTGWFSIDGFDLASEADKPGVGGLLGLLTHAFSPGEMWAIATDLVAKRKTLMEVTREQTQLLMDKEACATNSASINYNYQGIKDKLAAYQDNLYPQPTEAYVNEAQARGWMPLYPRKQVKAWFTGGNNVLRRTNMTGEFMANLWTNLDLAVDVNPKLTFTGMNADFVLPAAGYYEKPGIKYPVAYVPYLHYCDAAIRPVGEAKNEWEIYFLLAERIQQIAREKNLAPFDGCGKREIDLKQIAERYSFGREFGAGDVEKVMQNILDLSPAAGGASVRELKESGITKYAETGAIAYQNQLYNAEWKGEGVLQALQHFIKDKWRWPTLTGRQQFYIDHPWFVGGGESLPTYKTSPKAGGDYPFQMVSCHARWSVHSIWRDTPMMLRLQRGEPVMYLNPSDITRLDIRDGDYAEFHNDHGAFQMRVKESTMVRPGVAYYFHAWEPYQFKDHKSYKWITPGLMKPMHFAGGEGHVQWRFAIWEPGSAVQDTRVGIRRIADQQAAATAGGVA